MQVVEDYEENTLVMWDIVVDVRHISMVETYTGMSDVNPIGTFTKTFHIMVF